MAISGATISGGFTDPDATGLEPPGTLLNAVYEYSDFVDKISVDLTNSDGVTPDYLSIDDLTTVVSIAGTPITFNEISDNGNVAINVTYSEPETNSVSVLTIITSIESANTVGNIYITGNIQNAFPDKYWAYRNLESNVEYVLDSSNDIPDEDVLLHTYKPSFMRYINIDFEVTAVYDSGTETKTIYKKVVNDWDINRLALLSLISRENDYRSNNYPKVE